MTSFFRILCVTWNVAEVGPPDDFNFTKLLSLNDKTLPDLYAIGLQELKSDTRTLVVDAFYDDPWTLALTNCLSKKDYVRIESLRLLGIHLAIFSRRTHLPYVRNIERAYTRTGAGGLWGSKGAVGVRMDIYGVAVCVVNCHFAAHEEFNKERIEHYTNVVELQKFKVPDCENILDHDYVFWIGDLNFRLEGLPNAEVRKHAVNKNFKHLWQFDQLQKAKSKELILIDFEEGPLNFAPTFKYDIGTHKYDTSSKNRIPSYCDRILWHVHKDSYTNIDLCSELDRYTSIDEYTTSDHKPVIAHFTIKVLSNAPGSPLIFEPSGPWCKLVDNKVTYTMCSNFPLSSWDWIGLYKWQHKVSNRDCAQSKAMLKMGSTLIFCVGGRSNYKHFRDYATWTWASMKGDDVKDGTQMYTVTFNARYLRALSTGGYYLAYFSTHEKQLIGFSDLMRLSSRVEESSSEDEDDCNKSSAKLKDQKSQTAMNPKNDL